ncbi:unnamed protein product [Moneuplotes crassus]|uniref:Uncharacterized protein n=1 Tax=Euplotes crassus TaxID=5936 RepID=A0AAD2DB46_EUPCR|nr:unnamed protein product [Moneuplotes crassus]
MEKYIPIQDPELNDTISFEHMPGTISPESQDLLQTGTEESAKYCEESKRSLDMKYIMNCYDATKSYLQACDGKGDTNSLDLNIGQFLTELDENHDDKYLSGNMKYAYSMNTYSCMYSACFQALIDRIESSDSQLSQCFWKIKAGYNKLITSYFTKVNEIDEENKILQEENYKNKPLVSSVEEDRPKTIQKSMNRSRNRLKTGTSLSKSKSSRSKSTKRFKSFMGSNRNLSPASSTLTVFSKYRTRENRPRKKSKICLNNVFKSVDEKPKLLPLKSLKVLIEEICESKENFDKKCILIEQQCETMEQYLYTYLNQKYGLKSLVLDWVTTIVNSVNVYSHEESDPDVILFGRILKEECDFEVFTRRDEV